MIHNTVVLCVVYVHAQRLSFTTVVFKCCKKCQKFTTAYYVLSCCRDKFKFKMEKNLKITNKKQMEMLIELMTQNPDIGRKPSFGCNKMQLKDKWDQFTTKLNSIGPPIRNAKEWQRVWTHYKANLKRKLAANKRSIQATGGVPYTEISLNPLEQTTIELVSMQSQVDPSGSAVGLQTLEESDVEQLQENFEPPSTSAVRNTEQRTPKSRTRLKSDIKTERLALLKTQARTQEEVLKTLKKLEKNSYKNYEINKKMYELRKKKADLQMQLIKAKLELTQKRLQM